MSDDGVTRRIDPDERAWREVVERTVRSDDGCIERTARLWVSRAEFGRDDDSTTALSGSTAVCALIVLAIPMILYSELVTPTGGINYAGMVIGLVLMVGAGLAHRRSPSNRGT
ncbi:hypothetical protein [Halalkalicoccus salilacus]|jgi:hypothetical protein|uniref:hypothetical protein n=1 Tax=Halalkalicoccus TaxID=332246 RepID=UPI002F96B93F